MDAGLKLSVLHRDDDFLGVEIRAWSDRYAGATYIPVGFKELGELAAAIAGFPLHARDERTVELGSREPNVVGGCCRLRFHTTSLAGKAALEVSIEDDDQIHPKAKAEFRIPIDVASLDRFVARLHVVELERSGEAVLGA